MPEIHDESRIILFDLRPWLRFLHPCLTILCYTCFCLPLKAPALERIRLESLCILSWVVPLKVVVRFCGQQLWGVQLALVDVRIEKSEKVGQGGTENAHIQTQANPEVLTL